MPDVLHVHLAGWWRFSKYEVRDGYIRPSKGAKLRPYDPWQVYRIARSGKERPAPYESLVRLLEGDGFSLHAPKTHEAVAHWCAEHGLLGILQHKVRMATLASRWEPIRGPGKDADRMLHVTAYRYIRTNTGWEATHTQALFGENTFTVVDEPHRQGQLVSEEHLPKRWPAPGVIIQPLNRARLSQEPLGYTWGRFFPDVPVEQKETFRYPMPLSDHFWRMYAEPLDAFVNGAAALRDALHGLKSAKAGTKGTDEAQQEVMRGRRILHALLAPVGPALDVTEEGKFQQRWVATSLLASFAMMALQDICEQRRPLTCGVCGRLFVSKAWQATYCSARCRHTAQKRAHRRKKKEGDEKHTHRRTRSKKGGHA